MAHRRGHMLCNQPQIYHDEAETGANHVNWCDQLRHFFCTLLGALLRNQAQHKIKQSRKYQGDAHLPVVIFGV